MIPFRCFYLALFCIAAVPMAAQAQTEYFPYKRTEDGRIIAPFGNPDAFKKSGDPLDDLYDPLGGMIENSSAISTPHRAVSQLAKWSADIVVQALSISAATKNNVFEDIKPSFTQAGWRAYQEFLEQEGIINGQSAAFNLQLPELLGQGVLNGAYKWVYDVPVSLNKNGRAEAVNIVVQLTRVARDTEDEHDVKIETWKIQRLNR